MASETNNSVTSEEKLKAINDLRNDVTTYTKSQDVLNRKLDKQLRYSRWQNFGFALIFISIAGTGVYFKYVKAKPASVVDMQFLQKENENLLARRKMFYLEKEDFQKEKELFVKLKIVQDSTYQSLMANIFKQDSLAKLKNVIKADVVNTNTVNTVNAKSLNIKKDKK